MRKIRAYFKLLWLRFIVTYFNLKEFLLTLFLYYPNWQFARVDTYLLRNYIFQNPYRLSKKYHEEKGIGGIHSYGETPLTTMEKIARECGLKASDKVYELGAGRGRACFWLQSFVGCEVVGIEFVPTFVRIAQQVKRKFNIQGVTFLYRHILEVDYSDATVIYYYGTCAETSFIQALVDKLKVLPPGTKVITVSYPLISYMDEPIFELITTFSASFAWGKANVYLQVKKR